VVVTGDEVIDIRKRWALRDFGLQLPGETVLADHDWLNYVRAMTAMVPASDVIAWPSREEVAWAWPNGVMVVLAEPVAIEHTIISNTTYTFSGRPQLNMMPPHTERQSVAGLAILPETLMPSQRPDGEPGPEMAAFPILWIASDPDDVVSGWWLPGSMMTATVEEKIISESSRFLLSVIAALGHRLTRLDGAPASWGRGERRRVARELPELRVLQLSSGATVASDEAQHHSVNWTRRWMVRGHWRQQPCGPQNSLRRLKWIDPFVKGPADKPLDIRPTIWRTGHQVPDS
jgi:hypothetical protein